LHPLLLVEICQKAFSGMFRAAYRAMFGELSPAIIAGIISLKSVKPFNK
jgi:hypothetical protein